MTGSMATRADEHSLRYYGWRLLLVSVLGMAFSPGPLIFGSLGVLLADIQQTFAWGRAELMLSLSFFTGSCIIAAPVVGKLIDRFGAKEVLLPSVGLLGLAMLLLPASLKSLTTFYCLTSVIGFVSLGAQSISYIRVLSSWFDHHRGIAIGIAASGLGLGYMIMPLLIQLLLSITSWEVAYYGLAAIVMAFSFPLLAITIRNEPEKATATAVERKAAVSVSAPGMTAREALKTREFWLMTIALTIMSAFLTGLVPHIVPLIKDRGITAAMAATVGSFMGLATFLGRIAVGYLLDRFFAPFVAIAFFGLACVGLLLLADANSLFVFYMAAFMIGLGFGAESDLIGYLVGRYFGLKAFAQIYGYALAGFLLGAGVGPYLLGLCYEYWGSYTNILYIGGFMAALACVLFKLMGRYPTQRREKEPEGLLQS